MKEGEETGEANPGGAAAGAGGAATTKPTLGERRGLAPGALHVYTGADGTP